MKFFIVAILFAFATGEDTKCITIRRKNYEREVLKIDIESPYQLVIDHDTHTLFFSYTSRSDEMFKSAYLSLKTDSYGVVSGIRGGFANAINSQNNIVYMGGENGIYIYDYKTKTANNLKITNASIWQMFYKNGLYFTTYPDEKAYFYKNDQVVEVPALQNVKVTLFAATSENDLVYSNSSGVFLYKRDEKETTLLNAAVANGITSDIEGNIYYSTPGGIYYVNEETKQAEELAKLDNTYGIAIESNGNFIYSSGSTIFRLKETERVCNDANLIPKVVEIDINDKL